MSSLIKDIEQHLAASKVNRKAAKSFLDIYRRDYHTCDCALPHIERKWNEALGVFQEIRLCCMAAALQQLTGKTLVEVFDFEPLWVWDCDRQVKQHDGTVTTLGPPPEYLLQRLQKKGIKVLNGGGR